MTSSLKCLDKITGRNKCPDIKNPKKIYCDTRTGKCYSTTKSGVPHGFKKRQEEAMKEGETLTYDEKYRLFGYGSDIEKHKKIIDKSKVEITTEKLQDFTVQKLKEIGKEIDPEWKITQTTRKTLIPAIIKRRGQKEREAELEDIEQDIERSYKHDELDEYDIWVNELNKKSNPRILEYIPHSMEQLNMKTLNELKSIWK
jgi:hypothetical protein